MLKKLTRDQIVDRMDELLEASYGSASLGNLDDPLDELIYIVLSIQTGAKGYQPVYRALKKRFSSWEQVLDEPESELAELIKPAGLSTQKARNIRGIIRRVFDEAALRSEGKSIKASLDFLRNQKDQIVEDFLTSLPGVSVKTARCVMMYSLGRQVFPVDTHIYRILTRMGIAEPVHRKQAGDPMQDLVPPSMRHRLHVNLIHHGRKICTSQKPKCGHCPLISFCGEGLNRLKSQPKKHPVVIDLFAGPGGLSAGFSKAGYTIAFAAELDRNAAQTYRLNHSGVPTFEIDITKVKGKEILTETGLKKGQVDVLVGGPPCQGYSVAGKRNPKHPANSLYKEFVRLGDELGARLLVMENVPGLQNFLNGKGRTFIEEMRSYFARRGFRAENFLINSAEYGVPQRRRRIVFLAARNGFRDSLDVPAPTHHDLPNGTAQVAANDGLPLANTVIEAFKGLPGRSPGEGNEVDEVDGLPLFNHVAMDHSDCVVSKISKIKKGEGPLSYRRLALDEPGMTIIAGHRALPVHPAENRTITVREAARLQSFEDQFRFLGPRGKQPLQVANAVPPLLSEALARHLREWLEGAAKKRASR